MNARLLLSSIWLTVIVSSGCAPIELSVVVVSASQAIAEAEVAGAHCTPEQLDRLSPVTENLATDPASVWGDAAAIIVALQVGVICLVVLVLMGALCGLFIWLIIKLDPLLRRGQEITERVNYRVDLVANRVVERLIKLNALGARVRGIRQLWWR